MIDWTQPNAPKNADEGPEDGDIVRCSVCRDTGVLGEDIHHAKREDRRSPRFWYFVCDSCQRKIEDAEAEASIVPESGAFQGWKKCVGGVLVQVEIKAKAKRSNSTGRKCRAEYVKVLQVVGAKVGISQHDQKTEYRKGKIVRCHEWDDNRWNECGGGIHFFLTRIEAEKY